MAKRTNKDRQPEQKAYKAICALVCKRDKLSFYGLFNNHMGLGVAEEFEKNLDKGSVGDDRAAIIKDWILTHEADLAYSLHPAFFPRSLKTQWQGLIEERGIHKHVHSHPFEQNMLHQIGVNHPIDTRLKLDQDFTIEVESPIVGSVIALDRYRSKWYPMMLRAENLFDPIPVGEGAHGFPIRNGDLSQIVPMRQSHYPGEHNHCFLVGPHDLMSYYADRFAPNTEVSLHQLNEMAKRVTALENDKLAVLLETVIFE